ncbi:hypothetical protein [Flavobacterium ustbae]|uniref:hypothetical protein n=1 Tax=Flavobacterium ustbae TaxID=2488790 RepID=UPI000F766BD2|nr:hypothetical protein [Flavobacterium ustbae]
MFVIRKNPLFEIDITDEYLVINNTDFIKDNGTFEIESLESVELLRNLSYFNKIIEVTFGFNVPARSNELRINMENGFKDIVLTNCNIEKVELFVYEINQAIIKKQR